MTLGTANTHRVCAHGVHGGQPITYCWGSGAAVTLGNGAASNSAVPVVAALSGVVTDIHTTFTKTCAVVGTTLWCWGNMGEGPNGELGDGTTTAVTGDWRDVAFPPAP